MPFERSPTCPDAGLRLLCNIGHACYVYRTDGARPRALRNQGSAGNRDMDHRPGVYTLHRPEGRQKAVVLDSPHSGNVFPDDFDCLIDRAELRRVEDAHVDDLFADAPGFGASLLLAHFPRSYIDPNRAASDLDPRLIDGKWPLPLRPTEKSHLGHGLVWRTSPNNRPLYSRRLKPAEIRHRIDEYWKPYHNALQDEIEWIYGRHGGVWHLNCHSMPATSSPYVPGRIGTRADFVLGDRDGVSCEAAFTDYVRETLEAMGYAVRINDPYRGAELVRAYAYPAIGRHSLQIEINRGLYMHEASLERNDGYAELKSDLGRLTAAIAAYSEDRLGRLAAE